MSSGAFTDSFNNDLFNLVLISLIAFLRTFWLAREIDVGASAF
jgi:hypothetical protein